MVFGKFIILNDYKVIEFFGWSFIDYMFKFKFYVLDFICIFYFYIIYILYFLKF